MATSTQDLYAAATLALNQATPPSGSNLIPLVGSGKLSANGFYGQAYVVNIVFGSFFAGLLFSFPMTANAESEKNSSTYKENVIYGSDVSFCKKFASAYADILEKWGMSGKDWIWEDSHKEYFSKYGLILIQSPVEDSEGSGGNPKKIFSVMNEKQSGFSSFLVIDTYYGKSSYSSNAFFFDTDFDGDFSRADKGQAAFGVIFGKSNGTKSMDAVHLPYLFKKNDVYYKYSYVYTLNGESEERVVDADVGLNKSAPVIQRAFLFENTIVFTARQLGVSLVYRIQNKAIDDICYIGNSLKEIPHGKAEK